MKRIHLTSIRLRRFVTISDEALGLFGSSPIHIRNMANARAADLAGHPIRVIDGQHRVLASRAATAHKLLARVHRDEKVVEPPMQIVLSPQPARIGKRGRKVPLFAKRFLPRGMNVEAVVEVKLSSLSAAMVDGGKESHGLTVRWQTAGRLAKACGMLAIPDKNKMAGIFALAPLRGRVTIPETLRP